MEWFNLYDADKQPGETEIAKFIASPLWDDLNSFLRGNYGVEPDYSYSSCSGQPGWNVKYRKAGRSLCTLYPMPGFFIALVVIGEKEQSEAELIVPTLSEHTQELFNSSAPVMGGRWLMINVTDEKILDDAKRLIQLRRKIYSRGHPKRECPRL